jgi:hypothetical protein
MKILSNINFEFWLIQILYQNFLDFYFYFVKMSVYEDIEANKEIIISYKKNRKELADVLVTCGEEDLSDDAYAQWKFAFDNALDWDEVVKKYEKPLILKPVIKNTQPLKVESIQAPDIIKSGIIVIETLTKVAHGKFDTHLFKIHNFT